MIRALLSTVAILGSVQFALAQERAPTVPETIVEGMEVVDPLAFQATAAAWNTFVIRAAQLGLQRSEDGQVRELASMLIEQHAELMPALSLASDADGLPTAPVEGLDGRQSGMMGRLDATSAAEFDRLFLDMLQTAHREAAGLFQGFAENGTGSLQAFASDTLPLWEAHLEEIEARLAAYGPA